MTVSNSSEAPPSLGRSGHKALGAFYTPEGTADLMANWLIRDGRERVLEPSVGDGAFIEALRRNAAARLLADPDVIGVELAADTFESAVGTGLIDPQSGIRGDFLEVAPFPVDAVIGNPPYVRLRKLPDGPRRNALRVASAALGGDMDPAGSTWMPFILHAARFIGPGGRMSLVLPYEFTHVRYARPLWRFLGESFGDLRVVRVRERMFPAILQETVLLFADERGENTSTVSFETYDSVADLVSGITLGSSEIGIAEIVSGEKPFLRGLLPGGLRALLAELRPRTRPSGETVKWRIGYVSGDKGYFHPEAEAIERFDLPAGSLAPTLASGRELNRGGVSTSETVKRSQLFVPAADPASLTEGEREYVDHGEELGIDLRYKCRIRDPWYLVPGLNVPDLVLPVFAETPQLLLNDAGLLATNSFMCGYVDPRGRDALLATWYSSLTLLEAELKVHSLGGGVFVFVPSELSAMRVPDSEAGPGSLAKRLGDLSRSANRVGEFRAGDDFVLGELLGLGAGEVDLIREGADILRTWRLAPEPSA